jgi:hypothetical protein
MTPSITDVQSSSTCPHRPGRQPVACRVVVRRPSSQRGHPMTLMSSQAHMGASCSRAQVRGGTQTGRPTDSSATSTRSSNSSQDRSARFVTCSCNRIQSLQLRNLHMICVHSSLDREASTPTRILVSSGVHHLQKHQQQLQTVRSVNTSSLSYLTSLPLTTQLTSTQLAAARNINAHPQQIEAKHASIHTIAHQTLHWD